MSIDLPAVLGPQASPAANAPSQRSGRHRWFAVVVLVLVALFIVSLWRRLIPATVVSVVRVEAVVADGAVATGEVAFQAAGWLEADPYPIEATALIDGVVAEVPVLAGQTVEQGAVLARLIDDDQRLALAAAEAEAERAAAALRLAEARQVEAAAELARLPARLAAAIAERDERRNRARRLAAAGTAVAIGVSEQAALQVSAAEHHLADLDGSRAVLDAAVVAGRAEVAERTAAVAAARVAVERATLAHSRTVIRAPRSGIIQHLHVRPGTKLLLGGDQPSSATVAELFDPARLQVRVDVALADVGRLVLGQSARITCEASGEREFAGTVTRIAGQADVARNTLQAKVALRAGDAVLRPEMLCRVQFLAAGDDQAPSGRVRLLVPASVLGGAAAGDHDLWIVDQHDRARRVRVQLRPIAGGMVEVSAGLTAGAWVIRDPPASLTEGTRVAVAEAP